MAVNDNFTTQIILINTEISEMKSILASVEAKMDINADRLESLVDVVDGNGRAGLREQLVTLTTKFVLFEKEIEVTRTFKRSVWLAFITTGLGLLGMLIKTFII